MISSFNKKELHEKMLKYYRFMFREGKINNEKTLINNDSAFIKLVIIYVHCAKQKHINCFRGIQPLKPLNVLLVHWFRMVITRCALHT